MNREIQDHLLVIRTLMERSALYRRALAPVFAASGGLGLVSSLLGWQLQLVQIIPFTTWWLGVASFGLLFAFLMIRRQAWQAGETFWTLPAKRVASAMAPAIVVGLIATILIARLPLPLNAAVPLLVSFWHLTYGLALMSAGLFTPPGIRRLGGIFLGCGLLTSALTGNSWMAFLAAPLGQHLIMGATFGVGHLLAAIWLRATEPSREP